MRVRRLARLLVPVAALVTLLPLPASAHSVPCVSGSAREASADRPHVDDPEGDGTAPWATVLGAGGDIINAWVSGPSAWEDRGSVDKFKATMRMESLERHPLLARLYFVFMGPDGTSQWVRAEADNPDLQWRFAYGILNGNTYTQTGVTAGSVNVAAGTTTIEIQPEQLPARPADGKPLDLEIVKAESFFRTPSTPAGGNLRSADIATPSCTATLYEAAPPQ